jgi:hypothetical protein
VEATALLDDVVPPSVHLIPGVHFYSTV